VDLVNPSGTPPGHDTETSNRLDSPGRGGQPQGTTKQAHVGPSGKSTPWSRPSG